MALTSSTKVFVATALAACLATPLCSQTPEEVFASDLRSVRKKFVELAQLIPSDQYGWRPSPGARTVSAVFMHVASATYYHMQHLGVRIPKGSFHGHPDLESITDKESVTKILNQAFDHALANLHRAEASYSERHTMATHLHEHLGQAIAYTRSLQLSPPWAE